MKIYPVSLDHRTNTKMIQKKTALTEAVAQRCSVKKVFLEISQNSQENTGARAKFREISRNIFSYNTPPVAASGFIKNQKDKRLKTL